jgi:ABC-type phosphate transport system auxiliary subunit
MVDEVKNPPGLEGEVMVVVVVVVVGLLAMLAHRGLDFVRVRKD